MSYSTLTNLHREKRQLLPQIKKVSKSELKTRLYDRLRVKLKENTKEASAAQWKKNNSFKRANMTDKEVCSTNDKDAPGSKQ